MGEYNLGAEVQRTNENKRMAIELLNEVFADPAKQEAARQALSEFSGKANEQLLAEDLASPVTGENLGKGIKYQLFGALVTELNNGGNITGEQLTADRVHALVRAALTSSAGASI